MVMSMTNKDVIHEEIGATPVKVIDSSEQQQLNELQLIQEKHKNNALYLLKSISKAFSNPAEARRARKYVKRQTLQLMHSSIKVVRGEER